MKNREDGKNEDGSDQERELIKCTNFILKLFIEIYSIRVRGVFLKKVQFDNEKPL